MNTTKENQTPVAAECEETVQPSRPDPFDLKLPLVVICNLVIFVTAVAALAQLGWPEGLPTFFRVAVFGSSIVFILLVLQDGGRWGSLAFWGGLVWPAVGIWLVLGGTFSNRWHFGRDLLAALVALALAEVATRWWVRRSGNPHYGLWPALRDHLQAILWLVLFLALASVLSFVRWSSPTLDTDRFEAIEPATLLAASDPPQDSASSLRPQWSTGPALVLQQAEKPLRVGLALSGGGYRAAVFHAGVLEALEVLGVRVTNLSVVSGGAIVGSHYAAGGDPAAFVETVVRGDLDLSRELLFAHNLARLPFPWRIPGSEVRLFPWIDFDRLDVQGALLRRRLLGSTSVESLRASPAAPRLMIATTDLRYGGQIGLLPEGILRLGGPGEVAVLRGASFSASPSLSLSQRVALSGAFPGAFPGRPLEVALSSEDASTRELFLVDGGARDNSGLELLLAAERLAVDDGLADGSRAMPADWSLDLVLSSDAGASLAVAGALSSGVTQLSRTVGVSSIPLRQETPRASRCVEPVVFSPASYFLSLDQEFDAGQAGDPASDRPFPKVDPYDYDAEILRRLIQQLPEVSDRARALDRLAQRDAGLQEGRPEGKAAWKAALQESEPRCSSVDPEEARGLCAVHAFGDLLQGLFEQELELFRQVPTLKARLSREEAGRLQRLGRALVYAESPRLSEAILEAVECRRTRSEGDQPREAESVS
ncbi:MAG: patatin-like phospholipase family protein [Acidobacteriota bacterium]